MIKDDYERKAVEDFIRQVTVPLLLDTGGPAAALRGTGTLFSVDGRLFLITARHVLDGIQVERLAFAENPTRGELHTFGVAEVLKPSDYRLDVAALELREPEVQRMLRANWRALGLENVGAPSAATEDQGILVAGYPGSLTRTEGSWLGGALVLTYTQRIPMVPVEMSDPWVYGDYPPDPRFDLYYDHNLEGTTADGKVTETPRLEGVSGASVWEFVTPAEGLWAPERAARVVAIQSGYLRGKFLRAVNWDAVALVLDHSDPGISQAVRAAYTARKGGS